jgi:subtilase family serine protease
MRIPTWSASARRAAPSRRRAAVAIPAAAALAGAFIVVGPVASASADATLAGTHPAWASAQADRGAIAAGTTVTTSVYLAGRNPAGMSAYATAVSDPSSTLYHEYLTTSAFQAEFGATRAQVSSIESWLRGAGLHVVSSNENEITVTGSAAATEKAYGTSLHSYAVDGSVYRAPATNARIPASLAGAVLTVTDLDNRPLLAKPASLLGEETTSLVPGASGVKATESTGADKAPYLGPTPCSAYYGQLEDSTPAFNGQSDNPYLVCGYVPSQLRSAYGVSNAPFTGKGVTVAIVDAYGSSTIESDADQYSTNHGDKAFKKGQFTETVTPAQWNSQGECGGPDGWAPEETLDVEAVHAIATGADVHYYGANSCNDDDFLSVFASIVDTHSADLVSNSWGEVIYSSTGNEPSSSIDAYTQLFEQGAIEGISFDFSAGDCGAEDPATACGSADTSTTPQADFPTSDPWVTSVGGTSVAIGKKDNVEWTTDWGTDASILNGTSWESLGWQYGGGGGTSQYFDQPPYQVGVVPDSLATTLPDGTRTSEPMRVGPDVALDADPFTGFLFGETQELPDGSTGYAESDIGGTSLASPLFTGLQADAIQAQQGEPIGLANPAIYARYGSSAFKDVTATGAGAKAASILPNGTAPVIVTFGDDQLLKATPGYDDATGVGTPSDNYLWSHLIW